MTVEVTCACGCGEPLPEGRGPGRMYVDRSHRDRAYRYRQKYGDEPRWQVAPLRYSRQRMEVDVPFREAVVSRAKALGIDLLKLAGLLAAAGVVYVIGNAVRNRLLPELVEADT